MGALALWVLRFPALPAYPPHSVNGSVLNLVGIVSYRLPSHRWEGPRSTGLLSHCESTLLPSSPQTLSGKMWGAGASSSLMCQLTVSLLNTVIMEWSHFSKDSHSLKALRQEVNLVKCLRMWALALFLFSFFTPSWSGKAIRKKICAAAATNWECPKPQEVSSCFQFPQITLKSLAIADRNYPSFGSCLDITSYGLSSHQISKQPKTETTWGVLQSKFISSELYPAYFWASVVCQVLGYRQCAYDVLGKNSYRKECLELSRNNYRLPQSTAHSLPWRFIERSNLNGKWLEDAGILCLLQTQDWDGCMVCSHDTPARARV